MKELDKSSTTSRGFSLMTRDFRAFSEICRISDDIVSLKAVKQHVDNHLLNILKNASDEINSLASKEEKTKKVAFTILTNLIEDFSYLMAYYLFDLSTRLEYKENPKSPDLDQHIGERLFHNLLVDFDKIGLTKIIQKLVNENRDALNNYPIFCLIGDFQPLLLTHILTNIVLSFPRTFYDRAGLEFMNEYKLEVKEMAVLELNQELKKLKRIIGNVRDS